MGRGRGRGRGRGGRGGGRGGDKRDNKGDGSGGDNVWRNEPWAPAIPTNDLFEEYYKGQQLIPTTEWDAFYKSLQTPLPTTFRVTASGYFAAVLKEKIQQAGYHKEDSFEIDGEIVQPPRNIPWYPNQLAWHTNIPRKVLKKNPDLENFHKFLISQGDQGNITRQEAVSMLPPLFLDVQPHHTVLDMCAAPGSKTTQIIEMLHASGSLPKGLVIANDVEKERCYMLVHHTQRLGSPAIVVTNNPAQSYPRLPIRLDRILADVPCTGDGTLRKNVDLWRRWNPGMAVGLHELQVRIAYRAAQMLAVGGRMVYSTCSLNPAEDEAVVMELIRRTGGAMELVDVSTMLPELKYTPGVNTWKMMDRDNKWYSAFQDVPVESQRRLKESLFPPTEEEAKKANLHYTLRILPHLQDTGGFYIAVFTKKDKLPVRNTQDARAHGRRDAEDEDEDVPSEKVEEKEKEKEQVQEKEKEQEKGEEKGKEKVEEIPEPGVEAVEDGPKPKRRAAERTWVEDPFIPLTPELKETMKGLEEYYGFSTFPLSQMFTRSVKSHKVYYVTESIAELINKIQGGPKTGLSIVNSGVKLFHRHEVSKHGYRICQDSIQWVLPMITKRKVVITHEDLVKMLTVGKIYPNNFSQPAQEEIKKIDEGCVLLVVDANSNEPSSGMGFVAWYGKKVIQLLIKKKEITGLKNLFCPKKEATTDSTTTTTTTTTTSSSEEKKGEEEKVEEGKVEDQEESEKRKRTEEEDEASKKAKNE